MKYIIAIAISLTSGCAMLDGAKLDGKIAGINYLDPAMAAAIAYNPALAPLLGKLSEDKAAVHPAAAVTPEIAYRYKGAERILLPEETIPFGELDKEYTWKVVEKPTLTPAVPIVVPPTPALPIDLDEPSEGIEK